jgi:hypothetical protein
MFAFLSLGREDGEVVDVLRVVLCPLLLLIGVTAVSVDAVADGVACVGRLRFVHPPLSRRLTNQVPGGAGRAPDFRGGRLVVDGQEVGQPVEQGPHLFLFEHDRGDLMRRGPDRHERGGILDPAVVRVLVAVRQDRHVCRS